MSKEAVFSALYSVSKFCALYLEICNTHTVDFIVADRWKVLPNEFRNELSKMTLYQLEELPRKGLNNESEFPYLLNFLHEARKHTFDGMCELLPPRPAVIEIATSSVIPEEILMSPKKWHEVKAMTAIVSSLASSECVNTVIDFGTGKGYLATNLALNHPLNVLGIDSSEGNCTAADERNSKLIARFKNRTKVKLAADNSQNIQSQANFRGVFIGRTLTIAKDTDFHQILDNFTDSIKQIDRNTRTITDYTNSNILLSGLHVCGNLSPCMIKHFVSLTEAKVLCSVGCCYQHIQEEFCKDPFGNEEVQEFGFPMSKQLGKSRYSIGRNARMLASQSLGRIVKNGSMQHTHLFYRAVLQVILKDHFVDTTDMRVGKLASKCSSFKEYVKRALAKLQLKHIQLSDEELDKYLEKHRESEKQLCAFHAIRVLLAPCIETLILLDRLAFLFDQDEKVKEAYVMRLFDPVISPRCYALVAVKN